MVFNAVKSPVSLSKFYALLWKMGILSREKSDGEFTYCYLLKRKQLTFIAWVKSINTRDDGRGNIKCQKYESPSLLDMYFFYNLLVTIC
jgi:hypothetical protein